jgi:quinolinate synthase
MPVTAGATLHARIGHLGYSRDECARLDGLLDRVRVLKAERQAVILAHNYQRPEIFEVADAVGDSLGLSRQAGELSGNVIVFAGVHFMAETAKILNPGRTVLLPNMAAGCSLADAVTAPALEAKAAELRRRHPDLAVVTYVNSTAEVKAVSDVCCTSANAVEVVNSLPNRAILFVPDRNLAGYVAGRTDKTVIPWDGDCEVHEQITPEGVGAMKAMHPDALVLAHPECRADVRALADEVLSTEGMVRFARASGAQAFVIVTECGLSDRLTIELPEKTFYRSCQLCRFMKSNTLEDVVASLENLQFEVDVPEPVRVRAERAVRRMLEVPGAVARGARG